MKKKNYKKTTNEIKGIALTDKYDEDKYCVDTCENEAYEDEEVEIEIEIYKNNRVGTIQIKTPMELVGYEDYEVGK